MESFSDNGNTYFLVNLPISDTSCHQCDLYDGFNSMDIAGNKKKRNLCRTYIHLCSHVIKGRQDVFKLIFEEVEI